MRFRTLLPLLLLVLVSVSAGDYRKMSPYVRSLAVTHDKLPHRSRALGAVRQRDVRINAFVRIDPAQADAVWQQFGCQPYAQAGDIAIVSIPVSRLSQLSAHPAVRRIEASPSAHTDMDTTAIIVGATKLYPTSCDSPLTSSYTGKGVVLGIMDIGFDLTHPNFYDATATNYRIGAFWDHISPDTVGSRLPVGRDYVGADSVLACRHSYDGLIQTHGTHTLGIAAGSGYNSPYRGIAYEADICVVNNATNDDIELIDSADYYKYTTAVDALGFKYIFDYADSLGKPCVASFSEGYSPYFDEEDSLFAAYLDSLCVPGHIIVASAGNESRAMTYAYKPDDQQAAGAFVQTSRNAAIYRIKANGPIDMTVYAYRDAPQLPTDTIRMSSAELSPDSVLVDSLQLGTDTLTVLMAYHPSTFDTDTIYLLYLIADKPLYSLPPIAIVAESDSSEAIILGNTTYALENRKIDPRWNSASIGSNIHAPACFPSVIAVGATAHRLGFTNYKGEYNDYSIGRTVGQRSPYSSIGPTTTGTLKPDVMAPGDNIISSYSSYYIEANPNANDINSDVEHFEFQGRTYAWNANTGTSMSAPVVAGVIALWLQAKPDLTREEILDVLSHTCRPLDAHLPTLTSHLFNGYGEIDAYHGLLYLLGADRIEGVSTTQPQHLRITAANGQLMLQTLVPLTSSLRVRIYALNGTLLHDVTLPPNTSNIPHPILPPNIYLVQTDSTDPDLTGSQLIRL